MSLAPSPLAPADVEPLETNCEWTRTSLGDSYIHELTDAERAELDAALAHLRANVDDVLDAGPEDFPLPTLAGRLAGIADELINGRGVALVRGIEREKYSADDASTIYWGIGAHLGRPWPQNAKGHLLGDVMDQGKAPDDPTSRGNEIGGLALPFHCDGSDLVGLFCLDPGADGGDSLVANVVTIHNELAREAPELIAELYGDMPYDFRGEGGATNWYTMPVFTRRGDRLFCRYIRPYILAARRHPDAPRPSALAEEAMNRVDALALDPEHHVAMRLQPGDIQLINNYHVLHGRAAYEDDRDAGRIRHLKRLWLETEVLQDDDKPERFRMHDTAGGWWKASGKSPRPRRSLN